MAVQVYDSPGKIRRALDDDLFRVQPTLYWLDFATSIAISWIAFWFTLPRNTSVLPLRLVWFAISVLGFYRSLPFVHELVHQRTAKLQSFRWV
jgi:hypothetical protein